MWKSIVVLMMVGCSSPAQVVDPGPPLDTRSNANVACVANGQANSCSDNSWTYYNDLQMVSCNDVGTCKNSQECTMFDNEKGVCQAQ